jgi:hypothetical protein
MLLLFGLLAKILLLLFGQLCYLARNHSLLVLHVNPVLRLLQVVAVVGLGLGGDPRRDLLDQVLVSGADRLLAEIELELLCDNLKMMLVLGVVSLNTLDDVVLHLLG